MSEVLGEKTYREAAIERLGEAVLLLRAGRFAGGVYLAGRAVESMLRGMLWRYDPEIRAGKKTLATGHDLRDLLTAVRNLGVIQRGKEDELLVGVERVGRLWFNNMRFVSNRFLETRWHKLRVVRKGVTLKQVADRFVRDCTTIVKRAEAICQSKSSNKS